VFVLTIPEDQREGACLINGRESEYRLCPPSVIEWRHVGDLEWERREVLRIVGRDGGLVTFHCDDGPGSEGPYVIFDAEGEHRFERR
jgi:hypothetical protein